MASEETPAFPIWCDLSCRFASFPGEAGLDGSGSCRTFLALWCGFLREHVTKNAPCAARRRTPRSAGSVGDLTDAAG